MWYVAFLGENQTKEQLCGTDQQLFVHDLKTVRGVINRYRDKLNWFQRGGYRKIRDLKNWRMEVYRVTNPYNDGSYHLMATVR